MGLEIKTVARQGKTEASGKLHLDSRSLQFRGKDFRWSAELGPEIRASTRDGWLEVSNGRDKVAFEVGSDAPRWVKKILHPPGRLDKLGVKPEMVCWLSKGFAKSFVDELRSRGARTTRKIETCHLAFFFIRDRQRLGDLLSACDRLPPKTNIWVVYPKGAESITQSDVMDTLKKIGFGPGKTAAFDEGLSSMRYAKKR